MDTIFAIITPPIQSAVCIFRISGPEAKKILTYFQIKQTLKPRAATLTQLILPNGAFLDTCLLIYFAEKKSFTGEEVIEIHPHGSIAIQKTLTHHLSKLFRHAKPGEFTRQAVLNGNMNLVEAEGLHDLITSRTWQQHKQATQQMHGILFKKCRNWKQTLINLLTQLEGCISHIEEDAPTNVLTTINNQVNEITNLLNLAIQDKQQGMLIRDGIRIGIFGAPNAGKSTLMNKMTLNDTSIISNIPGTTTDIITYHIDFHGYPIILYDTAGIRKNSKNTIENMGIQKSLSLIKDIHIKIIIIDLSVEDNIDEQILPYIDQNTIILLNKTDICNQKSNAIKTTKLSKAYQIKNTSILNDDIQTILKPLKEVITTLTPNQESPYITQERHQKQLQNAINALRSIPAQCKDLSIIAHALYIAIDELDTLVDKIDNEEVLDNIFKTFCIGK